MKEVKYSLNKKIYTNLKDLVTDINKLDVGSYKVAYTITYNKKYSTTKTKTINIK